MRIAHSLTSFALGFGLLLTAASGRADTYTFSLIPASGAVAGLPGSTVGWGYTITNDSATNWLVTSGLSSDSFLDGTSSAIFDFPDLAPGATVTENFGPSVPAGLFEFTWDPAAPLGFVNNGTFDLSAQWWSGDPLNGGAFLMNAPDALTPYSVAVGSPVPEPSPLLLLISLSFGFLGLMRSRFVRRGPRVHV